MSRSDLLKWIVILGIPIFVACAQNRFPNLVIAEAGMVENCAYLGTISETSDPGEAVTNYKYYKYYDGELKVLERADYMGGTHLVWLYNYHIGSSGAVYRCNE